MAELVRRLIHEKRQQSMEQSSPSEIVGRHVGPERATDLGKRRTFAFDVPNVKDAEAS
jgi:hypothetical protein